MGTDNFWDLLVDWRTTDFYKYNPDGLPHLMNYAQYRQGRKDGSIPAPSRELVTHNLYYPVHAEHDGA